MKKADSEEVINIIERFQPKIKKSLSNTNYQDREDLEQEIKVKIIEKLTNIKFNDCPSIWELLE